MKRGIYWAGGGLIAAFVAWQASSAIQSVVKPVPTPAAARPAPAPAPLAPTSKETPMAQRVATLGLLNKRNGLWRDLTMKPGEAVRIGDVVVRLKACETTQPYEDEQLTGAFVQMIVRGADNKWRKVFSGWLYKESPSLNMVEHPIYDVWTKACQMRHPDTGPDTLVVRGGDAPAAGGGAPRRSNAPRSAPADAAPEPEPAVDTAADSNTE
jgi:hypothetical protein